MGYFITGLFLVAHYPTSPLSPHVLFLCPVLSVVPAPSSKIPWLLLLVPLVTSSPRFLCGRLLLITTSGWEALVLALHVLNLPWDWKAGGGWLECGVGSAEGWQRGWGGHGSIICGPPHRPWWPLVIHRIYLRTTDFMKKQDI